jgi:hypothetical protein
MPWARLFLGYQTFCRLPGAQSSAPPRPESASDPFIVVAASPDGESIRDRSGASFPLAASFETIETCDAITVTSFSRARRSNRW